MTREEAIKELQESHDIMRSYDIDESESRLMTALDMAIKALEQEPCEDEYIKVPKKALKYRTAGMVAYNAEWLKNNFDIERAVICGVQEPKWDRLYSWLNDMRYGIAPDENTPDDERREREAQVDVIDDIMEWIEKHTQEPKTGHWIMSDDGLYRPICDKCGAHPWKGYIPTVEEATEVFKYCPNCGCRMFEPQESEGE